MIFHNFNEEYLRNHSDADTQFRRGISKYLKNVRTKKVRLNINIKTFLISKMIKHIINFFYSQGITKENEIVNKINSGSDTENDNENENKKVIY